MKPSVIKLQNPIQHYAWGSRIAIARLQGRPTPSPQPEAELWIGDHPIAPSSIEATEGPTGTARVPLSEWIARNREAVLGARGAHSDRLPFLAKILAAARPLSLQVHPSDAQAREGYAREQRAELRGDERSYRDAQGKHEILVALSRFDALCGLRPAADLAELVGRAVSPTLSRLHGECIAGAEPDESGIAGQLIGKLHGLDRSGQERICDELRAAATHRGTRSRAAADAFYWVRRLCDEHPGDPLVAAPLLMNLVSLAPGEALVLAPGTLHSYLEGVGVEVMTPSDNVVRAGLSTKHVDREEFGRIASLSASPVCRLQPSKGTGNELTYATGTEEFELVSLRLGGAHPLRGEGRGRRVTLVLCVEGDVELIAGDHRVALGSGEAALVPASVEHHVVEAEAPAYLFVVSAT